MKVKLTMMVPPLKMIVIHGKDYLKGTNFHGN